MVKTRMNTRLWAASIVLALWLCVATVYSLSLSIGPAAGWAPSLTAMLPTVAGADISPTTIESNAQQARLSVRAKRNDPAWKVTVQRTTASWHPGTRVFVRRTSSHLGVAGGRTYVEIRFAAADFFWSTAIGIDAVNVYCQYRLTGLSVAMGTSNLTTITFTVLAD